MIRYLLRLLAWVCDEAPPATLDPEDRWSRRVRPDPDWRAAVEHWDRNHGVRRDW
jgi:hypothetical protein